ncbi:hypothetical protein Droror1_Dr00011027 [Drosera rotundifolia]
MSETRWDDGELEDDVVALFGEESFSFQLYIFFESNNQSFLETDHLDQVLLSSSAFFLGIEGFLEAMLASQVLPIDPPADVSLEPNPQMCPVGYIWTKSCSRCSLSRWRSGSRAAPLS